MPYPFSNLTPTSTFTQWYTQTNEISTFLNEQIVANGQVAYGDFEIGANASLNLCNSSFANSTVVQFFANTELGNSGTSYVAVLGTLFSVSSNVALLNPISSVFVNTALTVNATSNFTGNAVFANVTVGGTLIGSNARFDSGTITANNGSLVARELSFTTNGATVNSSLASASYSDYTVTGLQNATLWNATPGQNTVISGIDAHSAVSSSIDGFRILYLQNLSTSYKITLSPANSSSTAIHRFETIDNLPVDVLPRQTVLLLYAKDTTRWRVVGGSQTTGGASSFGNTTVAGTLAVNGNGVFSANLTVDPLYVNQVAGRVGIGTISPTVKFHSVGPNVLEDITTANDLRSTKLLVTSNAVFTAAEFYANGVAGFNNIIVVNNPGQSYIQTLRTGSFLSDGAIVGGAISGISGTFSGTVVGAVGSFGTLGAVVGTTGVFSGAVQVGGALTPASDATLSLGTGAKRWNTPFFSLADGSADGTMTLALLTGASGEVKYQAGFTGSKNIQTDDGLKTFTWKAGILVSVSA
jgi:hypothetical protein